MYTYIHTHTIYMYIYIYIYMYVYVCMYIHTYTHTQTYTYIYMYMYVCMYVHVGNVGIVCVCVGECDVVCVCAFVHTHTHTDAHRNAHTLTHIRTFMRHVTYECASRGISQRVMSHCFMCNVCLQLCTSIYEYISCNHPFFLKQWLIMHCDMPLLAHSYVTCLMNTHAGNVEYTHTHTNAHINAHTHTHTQATLSAVESIERVVEGMKSNLLHGNTQQTAADVRDCVILLQRVAVWWNVLQCVAMWCTVCCSVLQRLQLNLRWCAWLFDDDLQHRVC